MVDLPGCSFLVVILHDLRAAQLNELGEVICQEDRAGLSRPCVALVIYQ